jgi:hypothetical protein
MMPDTSLLSSIAKQMMSADDVEIEGKRLRVRCTSKQGLRTVTFTTGEREYAAIKQNPDKPSRWGELARSSQNITLSGLFSVLWVRIRQSLHP